MSIYSKIISFGGALLFMSSTALAQTYLVDEAKSRISFQGTHADKAFEGKFNDWSADIKFDANALDESHIKASFELKEAKTDNAMFDGALVQKDWFDVKSHPQATFVSHAITHKEGNIYRAEGEFELKGKKHPLGFDFTIDDLSARPVLVQSRFEIDRLAYDVGKGSDPDGKWVSPMIGIEIQLAATPQDD